MTPIDAVSAEAAAARNRYGAFYSTHEALGVLEEEYRELKDAIRANDIHAIAKESKQVSAVALRLYELADRAEHGDAEDFRKRSGCAEAERRHLRDPRRRSVLRRER